MTPSIPQRLLVLAGPGVAVAFASGGAGPLAIALAGAAVPPAAGVAVRCSITAPDGTVPGATRDIAEVRGDRTGTPTGRARRAGRARDLLQPLRRRQARRGGGRARRGPGSAALGEMDQVTQSNAARTEEVPATAGHLADRATELKRLVRRFRVTA